jgi:hypothetical protein
MMTAARAKRFAAGRVAIVIAIALLAADDRIAPMPGVFPDYPAAAPANGFAEHAEPNPAPDKEDVLWCALMTTGRSLLEDKPRKVAWCTK